MIAFSKLVAANTSKLMLTAYDLWMNRTAALIDVVAPGGGDIVKHASIYSLVWKVCLVLAMDPCEIVAMPASRLVDEIHMSFLFNGAANAKPVVEDGVTQVVFVNPNENGSTGNLRSTPSCKSPASISSEAVLLDSALPLRSDIIKRSVVAFTEHQRRRRETLLRRNEHPIQAKIKKVTLLDSDDVRRWNSLATGRRFDQQVAVLNVGSQVLDVLFHPLLDKVLTADVQGQISVWDYQNGGGGVRDNVFIGCDIKSTKITGIACVDWDPIKLLIGSSDGMVRLFKDFESGPETMIAAWTTIASESPVGMTQCTLLEWNQPQRRLFTVTGGTELAILDAVREQIIDRIRLPEAIATSMTSDRRESPIVTLGFADGWMRRYDLRQRDAIVATFRASDSTPIVSVKQTLGDTQLLSASGGGEVITWDLRSLTATTRTAFKAPLADLDCHPNASLLAVASDGVRIMDGELAVGQMRYHEGFLAQRLGAVESLAFHPRKLLLAAGCNDGLVPIYSARL